MTPDISVVVPTRNRAALLDRLLESFHAVTYPRWELIIVDDGSVDHSASVVRRHAARGLPIRYRYQSWGMMGSARNRGIDAARADIIAFTDDDCTVTPGWLTGMRQAFADHPEALGIQGKTVTDRTAMTPFTRQVEQLEGGQPYRTCNIAYRRSVLDAVGGFDPCLIRGEDVAMSMLVLERGPIVFALDAVVCHPPRPKEWADRRAWRTLLASETHFKRTYPGYSTARSHTLSIGKRQHVLSRWVLLPIRRYWRWHWTYFQREPRDYLRHVPLMVGEKIALLSVLPPFFLNWRVQTAIAGHQLPEDVPPGDGVGPRASQ